MSLPAAAAAPLVVLTRHASAGAVKMEAVFHPSWKNATSLGFVLNATPKDCGFQDGTSSSPLPCFPEAGRGYFFLLRPACRDDSEAIHRTPPRFAKLIASRGAVVLEIRRGRSQLRTLVVDAASLPRGPLQMTASKVGERLQFVVHDLPPLEFIEAFPSSGAEVKFAVCWPAETKLFSLQGSRRRMSEAPSPLEQGDSLYSAGRPADALTAYQEQARAFTSEKFSQQVRYKEAICLLALRHDGEAEAILEGLSNERASRWTALAACQLWLHLVRQGRFDETEAIFANLSERYKIEQLPSFVPCEMHTQIVDGYSAQSTAANLLRPNPGRVQQCKRALAIADLLDPQHVSVAQASRDNACFRLLRAYRMLGQEDEALRQAERFCRSDSQTPATSCDLICEYAWLLRLAGQADKALTETDRARKGDRFGENAVHLERARGLWALARYDEAQALLESMAASFRPDDSGKHVVPTYGMLGFLRQRRGDERGAIQSWKAAAKQLSARRCRHGGFPFR